MSVALRRSTRKRKCADSGSVTQLGKSPGKIEGKASSLKDESLPTREEHALCSSSSVVVARLPISAELFPLRSKVRVDANKSPVAAIQNPVNFYGKSSQNLSFSEEEVTYSAAEALRKVVKNKRPINRVRRVLVSASSAPGQKPVKKTGIKKKEGTKSQLQKVPQKFPRSNFMKKSLLETLQHQVPHIDVSEVEKTPPKRKFFSSSTKEKSLQMTTTLFGKQRISAATVLNKPPYVASGKNDVPRVPMKMIGQTNSNLSLPKHGLMRPYKITPVTPLKKISDSKVLSLPTQKDFLDSIDEMQPPKSSSVKKDLGGLDSTFDSLVASDKENDCNNDLMRSNCSELNLSELGNLQIGSPASEAFIQHYHYSPLSKDSGGVSNDELSQSTLSSAIDDNHTNFSDNAGSATTFSSPLSPTEEMQLFISPISSTSESQSTGKQTKSAWPIHYSRQKENMSNLKSKRKASKSLLPAFKHSRVKDADGKEQLIIDAGQNKIGAQMCSDCGMLYNLDSAEDVGLHVKFHNTVMTNLRFLGWKKERVVRQFSDGRVLLVLPEDPKYTLKKVSDVKAIMDSNLGFHEKAQPDQQTMQVYFFVMEKKIVGCLIAEAIKNAFPVISSDAKSPLMCSTESKTAVCGINRIWTLASHRRCQIASRLIDCMRTRFYFGCEVTIDQVAFSDPTPDGRQFAAKYTCSENFLVYK